MLIPDSIIRSQIKRRSRYQRLFQEVSLEVGRKWLSRWVSRKTDFSSGHYPEVHLFCREMNEQLVEEIAEIWAKVEDCQKFLADKIDKLGQRSKRMESDVERTSNDISDRQARRMTHLSNIFRLFRCIQRSQFQQPKTISCLSSTKEYIRRPWPFG
jgi:hypothetical protein